MQDRDLPCQPVQPEAAHSLPYRPRIFWIDAARGIAIILVVYGHAARAIMNRLPYQDAFRLLDTVIYSFHMPVFFVLAGIVVVPPLERSRESFIKSRLATIVYPYFLWSAVYWATKIALPTLVNTPLPSHAILDILWKPIDHLWFLYVLFVCSLAVAAVWPFRWLLALASAWALFGPLPSIGAGGLWRYLPWFTLGVFVSHFVRKCERDELITLFLTLSAMGMVLTVLMQPADSPRTSALVQSAIGVGLCIVLAIFPAGSVWIRQIGKASLTIYLLHTFCSAGTRALADHVYPLRPLVLLPVTTLTGLLIPVGIHFLAARFQITPYLGFGRLESNASASRTTGPSPGFPRDTPPTVVD